MAYGTPASLEGVEAYYTHIRGGRKPSDEQLEDLVGRYRAIGGASPLIRITESQRDGLEARLRSEGSETLVYAGMKHSPPFIGEVVERAERDGVDSLLGVVLAPHYSKTSTGGYLAAMEEASRKLNGKVKIDFVKSWHENPKLVELWGVLVNEAQGRFDGSHWLVCSAHSLPERILKEGDPYKDELLETSKLVADATGNGKWSFAFQSASHTGEPWLGPDILEHAEELGRRGERNLLVAPLGFTSDHLEILYDLDVECKNWAKEAGMRVERCDLPNARPEMIDALYSVVESAGYSGSAPRA
ncbi:MAG: ferrochelatase [archaeon]|nr:MAG: ferrochelatase [archaeon]